VVGPSRKIVRGKASRGLLGKEVGEKEEDRQKLGSRLWAMKSQVKPGGESGRKENQGG